MNQSDTQFDKYDNVNSFESFLSVWDLKIEDFYVMSSKDGQELLRSMAFKNTSNEINIAQLFRFATNKNFKEADTWYTISSDWSVILSKKDYPFYDDYENKFLKSLNSMVSPKKFQCDLL